MANEPERPIEKLLRAAAEKRREEAGAPFELHPATRRLLQGEVTRRFAKPPTQGRSFAGLIAQVWPRLALGVTILAALGVLVWVVLPGTRSEKSPALLAKNQPAPEPAPVRQFSPPAHAASPPPVGQVTAKVLPAQPALIADRERAEPLARSAAARPSAGQNQLGMDSLHTLPANAAVEKSSSAASRQRADRKKAAETEIAAASGTVAQPSEGAVNGASGGRYSFAGASAPPGTPPTAPSMPPPVVTTAAPVSAVAEDKPVKLKDGASARRDLAYEPPTEVASANRPSPAWTRRAHSPVLLPRPSTRPRTSGPRSASLG